MTGDSQRYFKYFFAELEARKIPYAILHSYQNFPEVIPSDIDYVVRNVDLHRIPVIQGELAAKLGWNLAFQIEHHVSAFCSILANAQEPGCVLRLDVCSAYTEGRCFVADGATLLLDRRCYKNFYVPSPSAEFIYVLAKLLGKKKSVARYLSRLRELWQEDRAGAQRRFDELLGDTGASLETWFERPAEEWSELGRIMRRRNGYGIELSCREFGRLLRRVAHPTGLHIALLGSDGVGKSTLLAQVRRTMESCFPKQQAFHFRPMLFQKNHGAPVSDPHARPSRNAVMAFAKVFYYFFDNWVGWLLRVLPGKWRSALVIFDRNFDDMLVDPRRYRIGGWTGLVRVLRGLLPREDLVFVLDASPEVIHGRKPELPVAELERQRGELRKLVKNDRRYVLVSAEGVPEEVAAEVCRKIVETVAARTRRRLGIPE
ncbi:MAG: hypothetical protein WCD79_23880 [Chthoniobacteraceae bacterium]